MINYNLPKHVEINNKKYHIRNDCDWRVVLDVIAVLNDNELSESDKIQCALFIFYDDLNGCSDLNAAMQEVLKIVNNNKSDSGGADTSPKIMDWEHDLPYVLPPINRVLEYEVRNEDKYTHWFTFIGAYQEIGECVFSTIISIRKKLSAGKKLENWEREFVNENPDMIFFENKLSDEDAEWLSESD